MVKYLVIVESPAKIKSISNYLGPDFKVIASFGHFRDLASKELSIDVENNFEPKYEITKHKIAKELKEHSKNMACVYIATDPDREGHGIAWHIAETLKLKYPKIRRMTFQEITKSAVQKALSVANADGKMDMNASDSYQARRVVDRLVGFKTSPLMWQHVVGAKSAGRVQSVSTRLVIDMENEIKEHIPKEKYIIHGFFTHDNKNEINATLDQSIKKHEESLEVLELCKTSIFNINDITAIIVLHSPPHAFKTSVFQQEASKRYNISPKDSMRIAQKLYEHGKISYHRTDTTHLSDVFKNASKEYILKTYGEEYLSEEMKEFVMPLEDSISEEKTKKKGEQAAHEAIRPTDVSVSMLSEDVFDQKDKLLYRMIWVQAVASLMAREKCKRYTAIILLSNSEKYTFSASHLTTLFLGFKILTLKEQIHEEEEDTSKNVILVSLEKNTILTYTKIESKQTFSEPPKRYTEASLIKDLEKKGIGRPSTYANIVSTIQDRKYVIRKNSEIIKINCNVDTLDAKTSKITSKKISTSVGDKKQRLFPTELGIDVTVFLVKNMPNMIDYGFTSDLENRLDKIADGKESWTATVSNLYSNLMSSINNITPPTLSNEEKEKRIQQKKENIIGQFEDKNIEFFGNGKFGPFVKHGNDTCSLPKDMTDISKVSLDDCIKAILTKRPLLKYECSVDKKKGVLTATRGPYGLYMKFVPTGKSPENYSFPTSLRDDEEAVKALSLEECLTLIEDAKEAKKNAKPYKKK